MKRLTALALLATAVALASVLVVTGQAVPSAAATLAAGRAWREYAESDGGGSSGDVDLDTLRHARSFQQFLLQQQQQQANAWATADGSSQAMRDRGAHSSASGARSHETAEPPPRSDIPAVDPEWRVKCAQRCDERQMDVTGVGVHAIATSKAEVRATIEYRKLVNTTGPAYHENPGTLPEKELAALISTVQQEVSTKAAAVVAFLQKDPAVAPHITKLRTSSLTLQPMYEWANGRQNLAGYTATNSITFRVDIPMAGAVIDAIVEKGVTRIDGINFVATPKELNDARQVAISSAVEDAMSQALAAVAGLGKFAGVSHSDLQIIRLDLVGVTRPEATNEVNFHRGGVAAAPMMAKSFASDMSSPVEGEEKTVSATVSLKIRF